MDIERYIYLKNEIDRHRHGDKNGGIAFLFSLLESAPDREEKSSIIELMISEYRQGDNLEGQEWALRKAIELESEHPYPLTALAEFLYYNRVDLSEALLVAHQAVELATKHGVAIVHALNVKARIARKAENWKLFAECLMQLMAGFGNAAGPDIAYQRDFMVRLPRSAPDRVLYRQYKQFLNRREALRLDHEVRRDLADLQELDWLANADPKHVVAVDELALLDRCRQILDMGAEDAGSDNWRQILGILAKQVGQQISVIERILTSFQEDVAKLGKTRAAVRAEGAIKEVQGAGLQKLAKRAIEFLK